jgi:hypothetical protein
LEPGSFSFQRKLGVTTPPALVALAAALSIFGVGAGTTFFPSILIGVIGIAILGVSLVVAWVSARSFLLTGSINVLFLGVAVLEYGCLSILAGVVTVLNATGGSILYLVGLIIAGTLHLLSGGLTLHGSPQPKKIMRLHVGTAYAVVIIFMVAFSTWALESNLSPLSSMTTQLALGSTAALFLAAALMFSRVYSWTHSSTLFWYSLGLATNAFAFVALLFAHTTGDLGTWTGIGGILLGSFYFLISIVATPKTMGSNKDRLEGQ